MRGIEYKIVTTGYRDFPFAVTAMQMISGELRAIGVPRFCITRKEAMDYISRQSKPNAFGVTTY